MPGPLSAPPTDQRFWGGIGRGLKKLVIDPIAQDLQNGNNVLKASYPLPYEVAQLHPAVGVPAAAIDYATAIGNNDTGGMVSAALSSVPVIGGAFSVGTKLPRTLKQAGAVVNRQHGLGLTPFMGGVYKASAAENVTQIGESSYDQFARPDQKLR